ncbi:hypothetical protein ATCC90586_010848 [Pythium insidiosum]|nr:hypothetical protein ATCC90586_010848 [Pythium insidiosum]
MDEREFQRVLERFPVVRKKTHVRVEWNSMYDSDDSGQRHPAPNNAASSLHRTQTIACLKRWYLRVRLDRRRAAQVPRSVLPVA